MAETVIKVLKQTEYANKLKLETQSKSDFLLGLWILWGPQKWYKGFVNLGTKSDMITVYNIDGFNVFLKRVRRFAKRL